MRKEGDTPSGRERFGMKSLDRERLFSSFSCWGFFCTFRGYFRSEGGFLLFFIRISIPQALFQAQINAVRKRIF
jgi:hypothetical protein